MNSLVQIYDIGSKMMIGESVAPEPGFTTRFLVVDGCFVVGFMDELFLVVRRVVRCVVGRFDVAGAFVVRSRHTSRGTGSCSLIWGVLIIPLNCHRMMKLS